MAKAQIDLAVGGGGAKVKSFMLTPSDTWSSSTWQYWIWDFDEEDASVYTQTKGTVDNDYFQITASGTYSIVFKKDGYINGELKTAGTTVALGVYTGATVYNRLYYVSFAL